MSTGKSTRGVRDCGGRAWVGNAIFVVVGGGGGAYGNRRDIAIVGGQNGRNDVLQIW